MPGTIVRKGYTRKAYTRSDGTRVKATHVPPARIKDRGAPGKGPKVIPSESLAKNKLGVFGYAMSKPFTERKSAIRKASTEYGTLSTFRKLNALRTLNKRVNPKVYARLEKDVEYARLLNERKKASK